ncbi:unnamed protein product, partial [marine sediment metagenome]
MMMLGLTGLVLGGVNIYAISSFLGGKSLPFFRDERGAFISAFMLGLAMCGIGINLTLQNPQ